jgi:hypothetical protein
MGPRETNVLSAEDILGEVLEMVLDQEFMAFDRIINPQALQCLRDHADTLDHALRNTLLMPKGWDLVWGEDGG